jgi:hypothetical protein
VLRAGRPKRSNRADGDEVLACEERGRRGGRGEQPATAVSAASLSWRSSHGWPGRRRCRRTRAPGHRRACRSRAV